MTLPVTVTHFDTAMVLIEIGSLRLLTDPLFDDAGTVFEYGPVRLEKTSHRAIAPADLGHIDAVLLSHDQHGDNLDVAGREFLSTVPRVLTTPLAASRLPGVHAHGLEPWSSTSISGPDGFNLTVTAVPAQHGPDGTQEATGPVTGFILEWPGQSHGPIYLSGDTIPFSGTEAIAARYAPIALAILNLGRVQLAPLGDAVLSLSADQAAIFAQSLQTQNVLPIHCAGWRHFTEDCATSSAILARSPVAALVHWPRIGEPLSFRL